MIEWNWMNTWNQIHPFENVKKARLNKSVEINADINYAFSDYTNDITQKWYVKKVHSVCRRLEKGDFIALSLL